MPDYSNTSGRTYCNASGSVRLNNDVLPVRKIKPSGTTRDTQHAYAFGQANPVGKIKGRRTIENATCSVPLAEWKAFVLAHPNWEDEEFEVMVSYRERTLGSASYNHKRCDIIKATPSESDGGTTGEPLIDLEIMPLGVEHFGKTGTALP
jgi:hypothetical protein